MKQKVSNFFLTLWYCVCFPFLLLSARKTDEQLKRAAMEDRAALLTERDAEFLRSVGVETDLETLRNGCKKSEKKDD